MTKQLLFILNIFGLICFISHDACGINLQTNLSLQINISTSDNNIVLQSDFSSTEDTAKYFKDTLINVCRKTLNDSSIILASKTETTLLGFIDYGIENLKKSGFTPEHMQQAETNINIYILDLIKKQKKKGSTMGTITITKSTIGNSFSICPLYPFC
ncbi:MAG: hypothetical protein ACXVDW_19325, partial [Bacteroidia bacterium]